MKGLLYKDLLVMKRTYRFYLALTIVFFALSILQAGNTYWAIYAIFLVHTVVSNLQNSDEASGWPRMCDTLPVTRTDQVNEKFLLSLSLNTTLSLLYALLGLFAILIGRGTDLSTLLATVLLMFAIGLFSSSLNLTTAFLFGPQKGNIARLFLIAVLVSGCMVILNLGKDVIVMLGALPLFVQLLIAVGIPVLVFLLGRAIAVHAYEKRTF